MKLELAVSDHAVLRYGERVKPGLSFERAEVEVLRLLAECAEVSDTRPEWASASRTSERWLLIGDGICFPVQNGVVTTCLTRAGHDEEHRAARNAKRKRRWRPPGVKVSGPRPLREFTR